MLRHFAAALAIGALMSIVSVAQTRSTEVVGTITRIDANRIEVMTDRQQSVSVALGPETVYRKWLMAKPWQQDLRTDRQALKAGQRVRIELAPGANEVAHTVWVVTGVDD